MDIINTISKTISSPPTNKLVYGTYGVSTILVQNIIYVFGGNPYTDNIHYQYALIPTQNPTSNPSIQPTHPTLQPTCLFTHLYNDRKNAHKPDLNFYVL